MTLGRLLSTKTARAITPIFTPRKHGRGGRGSSQTIIDYVCPPGIRDWAEGWLTVQRRVSGNGRFGNGIALGRRNYRQQRQPVAFVGSID